MITIKSCFVLVAGFLLAITSFAKTETPLNQIFLCSPSSETTKIHNLLPAAKKSDGDMELRVSFSNSTAIVQIGESRFYLPFQEDYIGKSSLFKGEKISQWYNPEGDQVLDFVLSKKYVILVEKDELLTVSKCKVETSGQISQSSQDQFMKWALILKSAAEAGDFNKACQAGKEALKYKNGLPEKEVIQPTIALVDNQCSLSESVSEFNKGAADLTKNANCPAYSSAKRTCAPAADYDGCMRKLFPQLNPLVHQYCP